LLGMAIGIGGLVLLLPPGALDWPDTDTSYGHGLILLAAFSWAICIVYGRAHRWRTATFQPLAWPVLVAAVRRLALASGLEGIPVIRWSCPLVLWLAYGGFIGTVLAYWAMNTVNRGLPAGVVSMALLGVRVVGLVCSTLMLDEALSLHLLMATALIVGG